MNEHAQKGNTFVNRLIDWRKPRIYGCANTKLYLDYTDLPSPPPPLDPIDTGAMAVALECLNVNQMDILSMWGSAPLLTDFSQSNTGKYWHHWKQSLDRYIANDILTEKAKCVKTVTSIFASTGRLSEWAKPDNIRSNASIDVHNRLAGEMRNWWNQSNRFSRSFVQCRMLVDWPPIDVDCIGLTSNIMTWTALFERITSCCGLWSQQSPKTKQPQNAQTNLIEFDSKYNLISSYKIRRWWRCFFFFAFHVKYTPYFDACQSLTGRLSKCKLLRQ